FTEAFQHFCLFGLARHGGRGRSPDEFTRESAISAGAGAARVVLENRFPEAGRFAQPDRARNDRIVNATAKMLSHFVDHLPAQIGPAVEHGNDDPTDLVVIVRARIASLFETTYTFDNPF